MKRSAHILVVLFVLWILPKTNKAQEAENTIDGYESISEALKHPNQVVKVGITGNEQEIKLLTNNCSSLKALRAFKIKDATTENDWDKLFSTLSKQTTIKEIELTFNEIQNIPSSISKFKNLETLIIWGSSELNYSTLFKNLGELNNLKTLELHSNGLKTVPDELKLLKNIENFTITDNETINYTDLIDKLSALQALKSLSLEINGITQLPANIAKLKNLTTLNIRNNYISSLPDEMAQLTNLDSIELDGNLIVNYVDEFNKLRGIDINYIALEKGLSEEEKDAILNLFPKASIDEKAEPIIPERSIETTTETAINQNLSFKPLVPELSLSAKKIIINADTESKINLPSGTEIKIPAGILVDSKNQPVTGAVTISYREFSNPFDIAFSGIPMDYKKDSIYYPLESAGMFEINAFQDNKPVRIQNGKNIEISLASSDSADTYNFYRMDTVNKEWTNLGKKGTIKVAKQQTENINPLIESERTNQYSSAWLNFKTAIALKKDEPLFNDRFYDLEYCHLRKPHTSKDRHYYRHVKLSRYKRENDFFKKPEKEDVWFNLSNYMNIYASNSNPELRAFNNMSWAYEGKESRKEFTAKYIRKKKYSDIRIEKEGDSFKIILKEKNSIVTLKAHPITRYKRTNEKTKNINKRYNNYNKALLRRETAFNKNLMQNQKYSSKTIWNNLKPMMSEKEQLMTYEEWIEYYKTMNILYPDASISTGVQSIKTPSTPIVIDTAALNVDQSLRILSTSINKYNRSISVPDFGFYNWNQPIKKIISVPLLVGNLINSVTSLTNAGYTTITAPKEYAKIKASYTDKQGNELIPEQVLMIDKRINSTAYLGKGTSMIVAVNSNKNLFAVMKDGSVGLFSEDEFKNVNLTDNSSITFSLTVYAKKDLGKLKPYLKY
jgi:hypothetical protein